MASRSARPARTARSAAGTARPARSGRRREGGRVAVLDRATGLMTALAELPSPATLNEVALRAGLSKATAFRILATLTEQGLVEQDPTTSSYRLGIAPLHIANAVLDRIPVHLAARHAMRSLCDTLNETIVLSVRDGDFRVNIDAAVCTNAIGSSRRIGEPRPLHAGAPSRVLMAALSDAEIEAYLKRHRLAARGGGPAYVEELWKDIRKARRTGLASLPAEASPEMHAVATVIRGKGGEAVAALHVAVPRGRHTPRGEARCGQALLRAAAEISHELAAGDATREQAHSAAVTRPA